MVRGLAPNHMGSLNVVSYTYTPAQMSGSMDVAADLQSKLRHLTGGDAGDGSKIRGWHVENIRGNCMFIICYEG